VRNVIKKILKEGELDWIKETSPEQEIITFIEKNMRLGGKNVPNKAYYRFLDEIESALSFLQGDAYELAQFSDNVNDESWEVGERMDSLNMMEEYIYGMGPMIRSARKGLEFFKPLIEKSGYHLDDILKIAKEHYNK
jgi:hypothetical protein